MPSKDPVARTAKQAAVEVLRGAGELLRSAEIDRRVLEVKGVRLETAGRLWGMRQRAA